MKAPVAIALTIGCAMSLSVAPVALGQNRTPTQSEITSALRPVPPAFQKGEQGLPTPGTAPLATPSRPPTTKASLGGSTAAPVKRQPDTGGALAKLPGCDPAADTANVAVTFPTIKFEFDSAKLKPESIATLQNLGKSLKEDFPATNMFLIEGHTDATGTFAYNQELSRQRAEAVKTYLTQKVGVRSEQLDATGLGYCGLANPADPRGGENRRVVIVNKAA
jgi:OmpA-OmpF porin, OOP family